jgi:cell division transport system ATP-binding protein
LVDLSDKANDFPANLSGGQQQRVAIARALANRPKILICDEPTGNLDPAKSAEIIRLLEKINQEEKTTILVVTHDISIVNAFRKRTIALIEGHVMADRREGGYLE